MSTSLLYHGWGLKGYRYVRSHYGGGKLIFHRTAQSALFDMPGYVTAGHSAPGASIGCGGKYPSAPNRYSSKMGIPRIRMP